MVMGYSWFTMEIMVGCFLQGTGLDRSLIPAFAKMMKLVTSANYSWVGLISGGIGIASRTVLTANPLPKFF